MNHREYPTHPTLRESIRCYWSHEELHTPETEEHRFLPDPFIELSFYRGDVWFERHSGAMRALPTVYISGLRFAPGRMVSRGMALVVGVRFYAWAASDLLSLEDGLRGFRLSVGPQLLELSRPIGALLERGAYTDAIGLLEPWLLERYRVARAKDRPSLEVAGQALYASSGQVRVSELAAMIGLSVRQFERRFKGGAGVTPKMLARLIRFERACDLLMRDPNSNLTSLAFELGYADQAHFIRDFRTLARQTPSAFAESVRHSHWFAPAS